MHFDEVYHARTATEFLQDWEYGMPHDIYEYTHPHMAKYLMAVGIMTLGNNRVTGTTELQTNVKAAAVEERWSPGEDPNMRNGDRLYVAGRHATSGFTTSRRRPRWPRSPGSYDELIGRPGHARSLPRHRGRRDQQGQHHAARWRGRRAATDAAVRGARHAAQRAQRRADRARRGERSGRGADVRRRRRRRGPRQRPGGRADHLPGSRRGGWRLGAVNGHGRSRRGRRSCSTVRNARRAGRPRHVRDAIGDRERERPDPGGGLHLARALAKRSRSRSTRAICRASRSRTAAAWRSR